MAENSDAREARKLAFCTERIALEIAEAHMTDLGYAGHAARSFDELLEQWKQVNAGQGFTVNWDPGDLIGDNYLRLEGYSFSPEEWEIVATKARSVLDGM